MLGLLVGETLGNKESVGAPVSTVGDALKTEVGGSVGAFVGFLVGDDVGGLARANDDPAEPTGRTKVPA